MWGYTIQLSINQGINATESEHHTGSISSELLTEDTL